MKILVLCTGNSCRSQMMHGFLQYMGAKNVEVFSAGIETHGVNPFAIGIMAEDGVLIHQHTSTHIDEYKDQHFDLVLTVCDHASENCPILPGSVKTIHHNFQDPSKASGSAKELISAFRKCRDEIKAYANELIQAQNF